MFLLKPPIFLDRKNIFETPQWQTNNRTQSKNEA